MQFLFKFDKKKKQGPAFLFSFFKKAKEEKGQVIVEYILLLVISVVLALALINFVRVDGGASIVFSYWKNLLIVVGQDISS